MCWCLMPLMLVQQAKTVAVADEGVCLYTKYPNGIIELECHDTIEAEMQEAKAANDIGKCAYCRMTSIVSIS